MEIKGKEGDWLLIVNRQVVASGRNCGRILKLAEKYKGQDMLMTKVLSADSFYDSRLESGTSVYRTKPKNLQ